MYPDGWFNRIFVALIYWRWSVLSLNIFTILSFICKHTHTHEFLSGLSLKIKDSRALTANHAKNKFGDRFIPFLVLGFWDKNTRICTGAIITGIFRPLPGSTHIKQKKA